MIVSINNQKQKQIQQRNSSNNYNSRENNNDYVTFDEYNKELNTPGGNDRDRNNRNY